MDVINIVLFFEPLMLHLTSSPNMINIQNKCSIVRINWTRWTKKSQNLLRDRKESAERDADIWVMAESQTTAKEIESKPKTLPYNWTIFAEWQQYT